jgi:hypothetical protein
MESSDDAFSLVLEQAKAGVKRKLEEFQRKQSRRFLDPPEILDTAREIVLNTNFRDFIHYQPQVTVIPDGVSNSEGVPHVLNMPNDFVIEVPRENSQKYGSDESLFTSMKLKLKDGKMYGPFYENYI